MFDFKNMLVDSELVVVIIDGNGLGEDYFCNREVLFLF